MAIGIITDRRACLLHVGRLRICDALRKYSEGFYKVVIERLRSTTWCYVSKNKLSVVAEGPSDFAGRCGWKWVAKVRQPWRNDTAIAAAEQTLSIDH